ncbi:DUF4031 domain-containing protein [Nesterenkonia alba]|uniref:DUF4031 domain-containing protein n=1 Tax=Nesterenkonia alba TaxID=515814 RepID=UPI00041E8113|nr:DUF4031 domain-containing protein [Nesterenkonia alba]
MTVFIDPPVWPAHGTVFSHLISDTSLAQLHTFAAEAGISPRAFDRDHYDVPAHRYGQLVDLGAVPVSGHHLVRILTASGLRVRTWERPEKVRANLQRAWERLGERLIGQRLHVGLTDPAGRQWTRRGEDLLDRWGEPHRNYHALPHLASVVRTTGILRRAGELPASWAAVVMLAGWYHDAVYTGTPGEDEEASARLAEEQLDGLLPAEEIAEVARLVRLTATHHPEDDDVAGAVLVDADLEVLGRHRQAYRRYVSQVRADYAHVSDADFARGRAQVLTRLVETPRLFQTRTGYQRWERQARQNVEDELRLYEGETFSGRGMDWFLSP